MSENFFLFQVVILKSTVSAVNHHPRILHPHWLVGVPGQLLALPLSFISTGICCCKAAILYSFPFKNKMSGLLRNVFFCRHNTLRSNSTLLYLQKQEHPLTVLWPKYSWVFSLPKSSRGSAHNRSHMGPNAGGSLNRSNQDKKNTHTHRSIEM